MDGVPFIQSAAPGPGSWQSSVEHRPGMVTSKATLGLLAGSDTWPAVSAMWRPTLTVARAAGPGLSEA